MTSTWIGIGLAAVFAATAGITLRLAWRDLQAHGPSFRRLCAGVGLSRAQRGLLWTMARRAGLASPAPLLISRGCFDRSRRSLPERLADRRTIARLRSDIFE